MLRALLAGCLAAACAGLEATVQVHAGRRALLAPDVRAAAALPSTAAVGSGGDAVEKAGAATCSYYGGHRGKEHAPFVMLRERVGGKPEEVTAVADPGGSGLCVFPEATCHRGFQCCKIAPWVDSGKKVSTRVMAFVGMGLTALYLAVLTVRRPPPEDQPGPAQATEASSGGAPEPPPAGGPGRAEAAAAEAAIAAEVKQLMAMNVAEHRFGGLYVGMTVTLVTLVFMSISTQALLSITERNALLAAEAFLTPFGDIFQFLEDAVSVKIGYAIGAGDQAALDAVLAVGVRGGLLLGLLAASATTVVAFWPAAIRTLLAPDAGFHRVPGCSLLPPAAEIVADARGFWLLKSWSWPISFAGMAFTGLLLGTRRNNALGFAMVLSNVTRLAIWLGGVKHAGNRLNLLGGSHLAASLVLAGVCAAAVYGTKSSSESAEEGSKGAKQSTSLWQVTREACGQGLHAMVLEVCVQLGFSFGIYMAGSLGVGAMYQVSAMQAAMPLYGVAFTTGLGLAAKIGGSLLVGRGCYRLFRGLVAFVTFWSCVFAVLALCTTLPFRESLAFWYGFESCMYASEPACVPIYLDIFGSGPSPYGSLQDSFSMFAAAAVAMSLFSSLKCAIYGCFDFTFMAKAGMAVFVLVYVPAICIARFAVQSAKAIYVAMYLPVLVLAAVFHVRVRINTARMIDGVAGPWTRQSDEGAAASGA